MPDRLEENVKNMINTRGTVRFRRLSSLSLRTKLLLGTLLIGGVAIGVLALFAYNRAAQLVELLSARLEENVGHDAEEQLKSLVAAQAEEINDSFLNIQDDVVELSEVRASLERQAFYLRQGTYWDSHTRIFQLAGGQYGNASSDLASVFIPSTVPIHEGLLGDLNTTANLDFIAPGILEAHTDVVAVYFVDDTGVIRYYPNISLANSVPPDFDIRSQIFYKIASPLFNPQKLPRWAIPHQDPAGTGLTVTNSAPVYLSGVFKGVVAVDLRLASLSTEVQRIRVGQTGYAFLLDAEGHIIAMPPAGYELFGMQREIIPLNESPKQTVYGNGPEGLRIITRRMVAGGNGLLRLELNGTDTYVAFTRIAAPEYSLALVVPVSEMNAALIAARQETRNSVTSTLQLSILILFGLFIAASVASIGLSQVISTPVVHLTKTADQITAGDLSAQAEVESEDEIGRLANAFNAMTARLRASLTNLEQQVAERTVALERRTTELETVAEVARDMTSYRDLDSLLSNTVDLIRERFGFYHAGIFLVDHRSEFAILRAASGIAGQKMLENHHKLRVGETGIVGFVSSTGQARVTLDVNLDPTYFRNPLLPETRSEIALPLRSRNITIGVLDVQSKEPNAFTQDTVRTFQLLADQLVAAIENVQLVQQVESTLQELNATYQEQTRQTWQRVVANRGNTALEYDGLQIRSVPHQISPEDLKSLENGKAIIAKTEHLEHDHGEELGHEKRTLLVPLLLSNQVIGVIGIENDNPDYVWTDEEIAIAEAAANRAAIALENARLLDDSQRRANRERTINEIVSKLGSFNNRDNILQAAITEIGRMIPGSEVVVQLQKQNNHKKS